MIPSPSEAKAPPLTSVWKKDSLALRLGIRLAGVGRRYCHATLTGVELAVDVGAGPGQSLTTGGGKEGIRGQFLTSQMLSQTPYHTETDAVSWLSFGSENQEPQRETIIQREVCRG